MLESPTSGIFNINGLQAGTYYLKEVEAPVGYNKLNEPIKITVQLDGAKNKHMFVDNNTKNIDQVNVENKSGSLLPIHRWYGYNCILHRRSFISTYFWCCTDRKEENRL